MEIDLDNECEVLSYTPSKQSFKELKRLEMMEKELQDNLSNLSMPLGMRTEISEIELDKVPDEF